MSKRCPSCGYQPIGPYTDNCPMCAEPVRNVRSSGGGGSGGMSNVLKLIFAGAVIAVLGVVGCCGVMSWKFGNAMEDAQKAAERMQAEAEADRRARTVIVSASDFLKEFQSDAVTADLKYVNKYLEITGVVERNGRGRYETPFVVLHGGDESAKIKIECFFDLRDPKDEALVTRLTKGQTITLRGEYDGQVTNVQLRECVLVK